MAPQKASSKIVNDHIKLAHVKKKQNELTVHFTGSQINLILTFHMMVVANVMQKISALSKLVH